MTKEERQEQISIIMSDDTFADIFAEKDKLARADMVATISIKAGELGVKRDFAKKLNAYEQEEKRSERERRAMETGERMTCFPQIMIDGREYGQMLSGSWIADEKGVRRVERDTIVYACHHPILPVRTLHNAELATYKVEVAYFRRGRWMSVIVDRSVIASKSSIVRLSDMDVDVTSESAGYLVKYLQDIGQMNDVEVMSSASRLGWHGKEFVPYCDDIVFDAEAQFVTAYAAIKQHGDYNAWLDAVRRVRASMRAEPRFFMAAAFSSVIVSICNALPFIANLYGDTEGGKTVTTKLCTSIWADPADNRYWATFKATDVALETRLNFLNHLPLILDDHANVPPFFDVSQFAYSVCNGAGKARSTRELGSRPSTSWQNVTITNGEQPLSDNDTKAGAANRILDFEAGHTQIYGGRENSVELCRVLHENYGFAGKMFVEACMELGKDEIFAIQKRNLDEIGKLDGKMDKQSTSLSIVMAADEIAERYIFKDGIRLQIDEVSCVLADASAISENQRCYEYLMDTISVKRSCFVPDEFGETKVFKGEQWGCMDGDYVYIIPSVFSKIVADGGGKKKSFLSWLCREGKLKHNIGRLDITKRINAGANCKTYAVLVEQNEQSSIDFEDEILL